MALINPFLFINKSYIQNWESKDKNIKLSHLRSFSVAQSSFKQWDQDKLFKERKSDDLIILIIQVL